MKNSIKIIIASFLLIGCYNQERNCEDFKTGNFLFEQEINGVKHSSTFVRTNDLQIETYNGKTDTASVRWINDCEFVIQKLHPKNMAEQKAIHMKILNTSANGYKFEYNIVGDTQKQQGNIIKIN